MLKSLAAVLAFSALASPVAAQFGDSFRSVTFHGAVGVETRFGQPRLVVVGGSVITGHNRILSWSSSRTGPWIFPGIQVRLAEVYVMETTPCTSSTYMQMTGRDYWRELMAEVGPIYNGVLLYQSRSDWQPATTGTPSDQTLSFAYCSTYSPRTNTFIGPCGADCGTHSPDAFAAVFDIRVL